MISRLFKCHKYLQASGANFPMASQMNELQWDVEQEFMSSLQVKTCVSHDPCKNTCKNDKFLKFYNFDECIDQAFFTIIQFTTFPFTIQSNSRRGLMYIAQNLSIWKRNYFL